MPESQSAIIGTMILYPESVPTVLEKAREDWFTGPQKKAFQYIAENEGGDLVSISAATKIQPEVIAEWVNLEFSPSFLAGHIANLEKEATGRKIRFLAQSLSKATNIDEATDLINRFNVSISAHNPREAVGVREGMRTLHKSLEGRFRRNGELLGMSYGIAELDEKTEGMHKGDLIVVAGPSSMGKTAFATGAVESACMDGHSVYVFSLEMTVDQLLMRTLASDSKVPLGRIRSARLQETDWAKMAASTDRIIKWKLKIDDSAGLTIGEVKRKIKAQMRHGLDIVLIDYLQIMNYDKARENQALDIITTELKDLAKELNVCIMLLSQLSRGSEKEKRKPGMTDLRGSGMIENNADVILFPYREAANCQQCLENSTANGHNRDVHQAKAEIIIGKQRQGERHISIPAVWLGDRTRFVGVSHREEASGY